MKDNDSSITGNITVIKRRTNGQGRYNHIYTYFNGREVSTMFDTCSPVSTIKFNEKTKDRIIKIEQMKTDIQGCEDRINSTGSEKEDDIEQALKIHTLPQKLSTEDIGELLPDFSGTSTP